MNLYCLKCGKKTKNVSAVKFRFTKNGRKQAYTTCACGTKKYQFVKA